MSIRAWQAFLWAGTASVGAMVVLPDNWSQPALYGGIGLASVVAVIAGTRKYRPRWPAVWIILAFGLLLETTGDFVVSVYERVFHIPSPFPSVADGLYLTGALLIAISRIAVLRARRSGSDRAGAIDATIVATGIGLLSWVFLMAPSIGTNDMTRTGQLVSLAYPLWDVMSLVLMMRLLATVGTRLPAVRLLAGASVAWLIADTVYAVQMQYSTYTSTGYINILWLLGFVLQGAAALHPSMRELTQAASEPSKRLSRLRLSLLTGVSLIAPVLLLIQTALSRGKVDGLAIGIASMVLFLLVVLRMGGLVRQVEEQAVQLTALAQRDGLTGVANRRTWDSELPIALDRARRDGIPLTIGLLDLDNFKRFNDEYGHQAGDQLLKSATAAWSEALRDVDLLCRYGGEEFGIILPNATAEQAEKVLDRLRTVMPLAQTFSAGVAHWDGQEVSDELIGRADRAMYAAKDAGRDRVVTASATARSTPSVPGGAVPGM